uniref:ISXO2-like transposase domain-containing protein n=1 Tax=Homalodisca liturata TaxID=320908 RepID=A0A1B6ICJ3_9HEMI
MCQQCDIGLIESLRLDSGWVVEFLVEHKVFMNEIICPKCSSRLILNKERLQYRCHHFIARKKKKKKRCNVGRISAKSGTLFERTKLDIKVYWRIITFLLHVRPPRSKLFEEELDVNTCTISSWCKYSRNVMTHDCLKKSEKLGGDSKYIEVVEAYVDMSKTKQRSIPNQLVLSGIEIESKKSFFIVIENPEPANLLSAFKEWILPNTFVVTNCIKIYLSLKDKQFLNYTVEHCVKFVKPEIMSECKKSMEKTWREVSISNVPRSCYNDLTGLLAEYQFKRKYKRLQRLHHFFIAAGDLYRRDTKKESG